MKFQIAKIESQAEEQIFDSLHQLERTQGPLSRNLSIHNELLDQVLY